MVNVFEGKEDTYAPMYTHYRKTRFVIVE